MGRGGGAEAAGLSAKSRGEVNYVAIARGRGEGVLFNYPIPRLACL